MQSRSLTISRERFPTTKGLKRITTSSLERYNWSLATVRERFDAHPALNAVRSNDDPQMLELFLPYFCAIGAQMTQPVEGWIRRAASRCAELGFEALAKALNQHAQAESGHHLMMIADAHSLANHWNSRHPQSINPDELLSQATSNVARSYCGVHDRNIAGNTPYAQIAIEYEIECLLRGSPGCDIRAAQLAISKSLPPIQTSFPRN